MASYLSGQETGLLSNASRSRTKFDIWLLVSALILLGFGMLCLYSEGVHSQIPGQITSATGGHDPAMFFRKQLMNFGLGLVPFAIFAFVNPRIWMRAWPVLYGLNILALVMVFVHGSAKNGSARWIALGPVEFQPSEMAKIITIITLSAFYIIRREEIDKFSTFLMGLVHVSVPMVLIFLQPHTGAAMVIGVVWLAVSLAAHVPFKFIAPFTAFVMVFLIGCEAFPDRPPFNLIMHPYQIQRLKQKHGYQIQRSKEAFSAGGVIGTGLGKGELTKDFPEIEDDFIFTSAGEELGLVGCTLILAAYGFLFYRIWLVMLHATEPYYRMIVTGILGILVFHTLVNLLMVTGVLPVIGLWLPFMSYGGTALWLCMSCVALVINVRRHERPILF